MSWKDAIWFRRAYELFQSPGQPELFAANAVLPVTVVNDRSPGSSREGIEMALVDTTLAASGVGALGFLSVEPIGDVEVHVLDIWNSNPIHIRFEGSSQAGGGGTVVSYWKDNGFDDRCNVFAGAATTAALGGTVFIPQGTHFPGSFADGQKGPQQPIAVARRGTVLIINNDADNEACRIQALLQVVRVAGL